MRNAKFVLRMVGVIILTGCSAKEGTRETEAVPVKTLTVCQADKVAENSYVGTVEELYSSLLSFEVAGNISHIYIREGQRVGKGQPIACLDPILLRNNHDAAWSALKQAEDVYNRMKVLYESQSLPEIKWIEAQTFLQQAKSKENSARKSLNDACIYTPFDGIVAERYVETGANVMPGQAAFKLVAIGRVKVKVAIPEKEIAGICIGQQTQITIAALGGKLFNGRLSEKNVIANPLTHTYEVKIELDNLHGDLMPGMVCKVILFSDDKQPAFTLPNQAVQINPAGEKFIWVVTDQVARRRFVKTADLTEQGVMLTDGVVVGEQVIVEGMQKVSEGMKIKTP